MNEEKNDDARIIGNIEKAIWVSTLHRDTSAVLVLSYIRDNLGIAVDQLGVRELLKKDCDISTYSFI